MKRRSFLICMLVIIMCFMISACSEDISSDIHTDVVDIEAQEQMGININSIEQDSEKEPEQDRPSVSKEFTETPKENISNATGNRQINSNLKVHFIDVGQGDSIFTELPNGETLLIDAGPSEGVTKSYISNLGYTSITYVVATHPDSDHITGMPSVLNSFSVSKFYMPEKEHTTQIFERMIDAVANNGCEAIYAAAGKSIIDIPNLSVKFLAPGRSYGDNNNASAVVKVVYNDISFMLTGDAETASENAMLSSGYDLSADILKVGHHGSKSSTSSAFLKAVNPKAAIVSVGKNNRYDHPSTEAIAMLNNSGIEIYRTDEVGTIIVSTDGHTYTINKVKSSVQPNAPPPVTEVKPDEENVITETTTNDNNSEIVYRTKTGSKYHRDGCSYLKSRIETTVSDAKNSGLTPCSRCNPPQ